MKATELAVSKPRVVKQGRPTALGSDRGSGVFKGKNKQEFLQIPGKIPVTSKRLKNSKIAQVSAMNSEQMSYNISFHIMYLRVAQGLQMRYPIKPECVIYAALWEGLYSIKDSKSTSQLLSLLITASEFTQRKDNFQLCWTVL